jgi:3,4-dihydroxy-9,10-secoandrosta-1,3,5(10)-triene-9,17-dione 4,5-dioxygenase
MPVRSLGYLRLDVADLPAWERFAGEFLGLMGVDGDDPDSRYFRMDDLPPRLVLTPAPESALGAIGLEMGNPKELAELVAKVEVSGAKVRQLDDTECRDRRITGGVAFEDPGGNPFEAFYGPVLNHRAAVLPTVSAFVTGDQGMGHVIVTAPDGPATFAFYTDVLGFVERNTMRLPGAPAADGTPQYQTMWFLGCNPRHHTIGILPMPGPARLIHFMVEGASIDDVGRALDRAERLGIPIMQTLGRHTNDRMVSFYVISPDGSAVEFGYDGMRVGPNEATYEITEGAFWGHKFLQAPKL